MSLNIIEAQDLLDNDMKQDEVDFLLAIRQGVALYDVPDAMMKNLQDHNLVQIVPFDHPQAHNAIKGVIPSEDGIKVLNVLDNRTWAQSFNTFVDDGAATPQNDALYKAQAMENDDAYAPDPEDVPQINSVDDDAQADAQQQFATGDPSAEAPETEGKVVTKKTKTPKQNGDQTRDSDA